MIGVQDFFGDHGPLAARYRRETGAEFEVRPQQIEMADAVESALIDRARLFVEAGTGVGKSFAYLVPAVRRIIERGERVIISTHTIALQEQLIRKDIPLLMEVLRDVLPAGSGAARPSEGEAGGAHDGRDEDAYASSDTDEERPPFTAELVKGRGNYVSIRRLELASKRQERLFTDAASRRSLRVIEDWAYGTADGSLATLPELERTAVWDRVQSDSGNCMGRKCPRYELCFYQSARRRAERADLLVCNHALFFSDLALRVRDTGFLPKYDHVILDEAHTVEDVASEHFGLSLSEGRVMHLLGVLLNSRTGKGALAVPIKTEGDDGDALLASAWRAVVEAEEAARYFFEQVIGAARAGSGDGAAGGPGASARLREVGAIDNVISPAFARLASRLKSLKTAASADEDRYELNSYAERAALVAAEGEALCEQTPEGCVFWAEAQASRGGTSVRGVLACSPVEVAPVLANTLFSLDASVTLASATLTTRRGSFSHFTERLGCPEARTLALGSPFDHATQTEVLIEAQMPDPRSREYRAKLAAAIEHHVRATDGGAFVLFTSFRELSAAARALEGTLNAAGLGVMVQGQQTARGRLLEYFRAGDRNVLFGTASFWQGVDVRGAALRNVIITRLPFEPPDRPLTQARAELIEERGGSAFFEDQLPRAVVRFKQGVGRLIRSASDSGRVVILDPRVVTKSYGRQFLDALPEGVEVQRVERDAASR